MQNGRNSKPFVLLFVLILSLVCLQQKKFKHFPPGPYGLPVVGYLPFLGNSPHKIYGDLGKKYGKIFSVTFGSLPIVILNDLELIRKAFRQDVFQGRPKSVLAMSISSDGLTFNEGMPWYQQRKFTLKALRDLGLGKTSLESSIQDEVQNLIDYFKNQTDKPISLKHTLEIAVINTLWSIVASKKYCLDDPEAIHLHTIQIVTSANLISGFIEPEVAGPVWFMPWLAKMAPDSTGFTALKLAVENMSNIFQKLVDERMKTFSEDKLENFVDYYLKEIQNTTDSSSSFYKDVGINNLVHVLIDLFTAGSDTTSATLCWAFLYLLHYPEILERVRQEIDSIVGRHTLPSSSDRARMPYTEATMLEIFRMSSIVCGSLLHSTLEQTTFEGYTLPKETIVMANLHHVHHDPEYWGDPETFRPERFLTSDGYLKKDDHCVPFSVGKRICPAEGLAATNFFLFFTGLVQNFVFEIHRDFSLPSLEPKPGLVLATKPYKIVLRNSKPIIITKSLDKVSLYKGFTLTCSIQNWIHYYPRYAKYHCS